jgi:hypothetical protein
MTIRQMMKLVHESVRRMTPAEIESVRFELERLLLRPQKTPAGSYALESQQ